MKLIGIITPRKGPPILNDMRKRAENLGDPLNSIHNMLLSSVQQNFDEEGRPTGWDELADSTKAFKKKAKKEGHILDFSGQLSSSISADSRVEGNSVLIGSAKPYARIHDLGGKAGKGRNVLIPQREFLLFQDEDLIEAEEILTDHLMGR